MKPQLTMDQHIRAFDTLDAMGLASATDIDDLIAMLEQVAMDL